MTALDGAASDLPSPLVHRLAELGLEPGAVRVDQWALSLGHVARAFAEGVVVDVALTERGRADLEFEQEGRRWAARGGIRTPRILDRGSGWMVGELWPNRPPGGVRFVEEAVTAADRIGNLQPLPWMGAAPDRWRAPRRGRLLRAARLVRGGLRISEFLAARRAAAARGPTATAHGDFHPGNLLFDADRGRLAVIDWTHAGTAARHTDLVRLWGQLPADEDSAVIADVVLRKTARADRPALGALWHWLAVRQLAEHLTGPVAARGADYPQLLRRRLVAARTLARDLGSSSIA